MSAALLACFSSGWCNCCGTGVALAAISWWQLSPPRQRRWACRCAAISLTLWRVSGNRAALSRDGVCAGISAAVRVFLWPLLHGFSTVRGLVPFPLLRPAPSTISLSFYLCALMLCHPSLPVAPHPSFVVGAGVVGIDWGVVAALLL